MNSITVDCTGNIEYCIDDDKFVNNPIDKFDHYKFKDLPGKMATFTLDIKGLSFELIYDLSEYDEKYIETFVRCVEERGPRMEIEVCPGANQDSCIIYENGEITFEYQGAGNSYTKFKITVLSESVIDALKRLI